MAVSRIPVVFLSAYGRDETVATVLDKGTTDYIVKPFPPTEPVARVRAALHRFGEPPFPGAGGTLPAGRPDHRPHPAESDSHGTARRR